MSESIKISATIITFNEEKKIEPCIQSLLGVADEIVVVDSFSTDNTEAICKKYPVIFIQCPFEGYVTQKNVALMHAKYDYVLSLDADERLSEELQKSILAVKENWSSAGGYVVKRFNFYCGKWMHFSGWYEKKLRLWNRKSGEWIGNEIHEVVKTNGPTQTLKGHLLHYAYLSVDEHILQVNKFADMAAKAKFKKGEKVSFVVNVICSPVFRFVRTYFFQLGFLDGYYGFVFCSLSAYMTFLKYLKLYEYKRKASTHN